jgi:hypothetical protein
MLIPLRQQPTSTPTHGIRADDGEAAAPSMKPCCLGSMAVALAAGLLRWPPAAELPAGRRVMLGMQRAWPELRRCVRLGMQRRVAERRGEERAVVLLVEKMGRR